MVGLAEPRITVNEMKRRLEAGEEFTILDTRNPFAWAQSEVRIPGAIRVPHEQWADALPRIPKDRPIVTYCT